MSGAAATELETEALLGLRHLAARMKPPYLLPRTNLPGGIVHKRRGRGLEVHDIRLWSEGDDIRHLDRNATARTGIPHVRTFRDERERSTLLVADFRPPMLFGTRRVFRSVAAGEALALLGWRAIAEGGRAGLVAGLAGATRFARQGRGARAMVGLIGEMVQAHREALVGTGGAGCSLTTLLEEAAGLAGHGASIIVATSLDEEGAGFAALVEQIARQHDVLFVLTADAFEISPPAGAYPYLTMRGEAGWMVVAGSARPDERVARLHKLGASAMMLDTRLDAEAMARALERTDG